MKEEKNEEGLVGRFAKLFGGEHGALISVETNLEGKSKIVKKEAL